MHLFPSLRIIDEYSAASKIFTTVAVDDERGNFNFAREQDRVVFRIRVPPSRRKADQKHGELTMSMYPLSRKTSRTKSEPTKNCNCGISTVCSATLGTCLCSQRGKSPRWR